MGTIHIVGLGPGDAGLITLTAFRLMKEARCIDKERHCPYNQKQNKKEERYDGTDVVAMGKTGFSG